MRKRNLVPYEPPPGTSCEQWGVDVLHRSVDAMASPTWSKPDTAPVLDVRQYATDIRRNTSKISPFLAIGVLSPHQAFSAWMGTTSRDQPSHTSISSPSSAIAQLLWREEFHAVSRLPGFWKTRNEVPWRSGAKPNAFWRRDANWAITAATDTTLTTFLTATTPYEDLNQAVVVLVRDGWVHHLRRHIIADYLTRGHCNADWMLGESWFRQTLVDHDACINRCNWLWLSGCEFSTKQLLPWAHYGWGDYVRRKSKKVVLAVSQSGTE